MFIVDCAEGLEQMSIPLLKGWRLSLPLLADIAFFALIAEGSSSFISPRRSSRFHVESESLSFATCVGCEGFETDCLLAFFFILSFDDIA